MRRQLCSVVAIRVKAVENPRANPRKEKEIAANLVDMVYLGRNLPVMSSSTTQKTIIFYDKMKTKKQQKNPASIHSSLYHKHSASTLRIDESVTLFSSYFLLFFL
jgi:hypothetical protein